MRDKAEDRSLLLELRFELRNSDQRLGGIAVQVEDDECGSISAVFVDLCRKFLDGFHEPDLHPKLLRSLLDLAGEEQVVNEDVDPQRSVSADLQGLHLGVGKIRGALLRLEVPVAALLLAATAAWPAEAAKASAPTLAVVAVLALAVVAVLVVAVSVLTLPIAVVHGTGESLPAIAALPAAALLVLALSIAAVLLRRATALPTTTATEAATATTSVTWAARLLGRRSGQSRSVTAGLW